MRDRVIRWNLICSAFEATIIILCSTFRYAVLTHFLLESNVGKLSLASTWLVIVGALTMTKGIANVISREVAQKEDLPKLVTNGLIILIVLTTFVLIFAYPLFLLIGYPASHAILFSYAIFPTIILSPFLISNAVLVGKERIPLLSVLTAISTIIELGIVWFATSYNLSIEIIALSLCSASILNAALCYYFAPLHAYFSWKLADTKQILFILNQAIPSLLGSIAICIYVRIDIIMIERMVSEEAVAHYSSAYLILDNILIFSGLTLGALLPTFARLASESVDSVCQLYYNTIRLLVYLLCPIAVLIAVFAGPILSGLYGQQYSDAALSLKFLMLSAIFAFLNAPSGYILFSYRKQHIYMWGVILCALLNVVLNLFLIPQFGYQGAAIATAITELALCIFSYTVIFKVIGYVPIRFAIATMSLRSNSVQSRELQQKA